MKKLILITSMAVVTPLLSIAADNTAYTELSEEQMKAVSHLVKALKDIKVIVTNKPVTEKKIKNPFDEKKEFVMPPRPKGESMTEKLEETMRQTSETSNIIRNAEPKSDNSQAESEQESETGEKTEKAEKSENELKELEDALAKLEKEFEKLSQRKSLDKQDKANLEKFARSTEKTQADVQENNLEEAALAQQKLEADIKKNLDTLNKKSDERTRQAFEDAREKADEAAHESQENTNADAKANRAKQLAELAELAEKLKNDALDEYEKGSRENFDRLAQAAQKVHDEAKNTAQSPNGAKQQSGEDAKQIQNMNQGQSRTESLKDELSEIQHAQKTPEQIASEALERAEIMANELKFIAKAGYKDATPQDLKKLASELSRSIEDMDYAMKNMPQENDAKNMDKKKDSRGNTRQSKNTAENEGLPSSEVEALLDSLYNTGRRKALPAPDELMKLHDSIDSIMRQTEKRLKEKRAQELIESFSPDEIPQKYQQEVPKYFQRLSEDENK